MLFEIRVALVISMLGSFRLLADAHERLVEHPTGLSGGWLGTKAN